MDPSLHAFPNTLKQVVRRALPAYLNVSIVVVFYATVLLHVHHAAAPSHHSISESGDLSLGQPPADLRLNLDDDPDLLLRVMKTA